MACQRAATTAQIDHSLRVHQWRKMVRLARCFLISASILLAATGGPAEGAETGQRPNIVVIMADDMGFSDIGCYGSEIRTPNLDRLAREGTRLSSFYNNAKCEPTRASLLTGKYPHRVGAGANVAYRSPTFGEVMRRSGYRTLMTGKWHAAEKPFDRGFDRHFGLTDGCCNYFNPGLPRPGEPAPSHKRFPRRWAIDSLTLQPYTPTDPDFYTTDAFTDYAIDYLETYQNEDRPFLLYIAYTAPHYPMHAWPEDIERYLDTYASGWGERRTARYQGVGRSGVFASVPQLSPTDPNTPNWDSLTEEVRRDWQRRMAVYAAMIDRMDQNIGRLLDQLEKTGELDNTLILFLADNGGESAGNDWSRVQGTPAGPLNGYRTVGQPWANVSNVPFRKYKTFNHEGGICTPLIARWPGVVPAGGVSHQVGHVIDILPTMMEIGGADYPNTWNGQPLPACDGESLLAALKDVDRREPRTLYWQWSRAGAIRVGDWKLVRTRQGTEQGPAPWELYDLRTDRTELHDLAGDQPRRVEQMSQAWQSWREQ